ncbi:rCG50506 [Rattus norvegicus]|uniref:Small ribosomal subunit protein eS10 n=1 Tax=Rattus norvegicus TaxID=10116 RepID=A6KC81_RAT|nr:rCG50506 [Rattus norvegicus]
MLMSKKNGISIYEVLFKEVMMAAKKEVHMAKHPKLADKDMPSLHVMKVMQSQVSGLHGEAFAWRHFYRNLMNEGIQYLQGYLHLPAAAAILRLAGQGPKVQRMSNI